MNIELQNKIYSQLNSVSGLTNRVFYQKSDVNSKDFPRCVFSSIVNARDYDTIGKYETELLQVSLFDNFQSTKVANLKSLANDVENKLTRNGLSGTTTNSISRCKLDNTRISELEGIFQIDLTFRIMKGI